MIKMVYKLRSNICSIFFLKRQFLKVTPKIPQTLAEIVTFGKGYIRIGDENGINIVITYDGHVMQFSSHELLQDKSLF